jgi:hypothetical protein
MRFDGATLPCAVGTDGPDGSRMSDGRAGHICFGPYCTLEPGAYVAGFYMRALPGSAVNSVSCDVFAAGREALAFKSISTDALFEDTLTLVSMEFDLDTRVEGIEIRAYVQDGVLVEVAELVVFSKRPRTWSGK